MKPIFWKPKMLVCTLRGEGGGGLKKCTVCTLMKMLTFLDGPLLGLLNVLPVHLKLKLKYFPFRILTCWSRLFWHNTSYYKVAVLLFHGSDLVSLITFEGTILYQAVSCFSGKKLPLIFQSVMYLYFKYVCGK